MHFVLLLGLLLAATPVIAQGNYASWTAYKTICINTTSVGANITNLVLRYPMLVRLGAADSDVFISGKSGGADLRFAKLNVSPLPYQIDQWDAVGRTAAVWVLLDTVKGNDSTFFTMYWGNAAATDSSNGGAVFDTANGFAGVYHLSNFNDATKNGFNGASDGTTDTAGVIGRARSFNGMAGDSIMIPGLMGQPAALTLSAWEYSNYFPPGGYPPGGDVISLGDNAGLRTDSTNLQGFWYNGSGWNVNIGPTESDIINSGWVYVAFVCDPANGSEINYVNGVSNQTNTSTNATVAITYTAGGTATYIGHHGTGKATYNYGGLIDEPRVETVARSADWIQLNFLTQQVGATVVKVGPTHPMSAVQPVSVARLETNAFEVKPMRQGILFRLPANMTRGVITLIDLTGRTLATINVENGAQETQWQGRLVAGPYIARLAVMSSRSGEALSILEQRVIYAP